MNETKENELINNLDKFLKRINSFELGSVPVSDHITDLVSGIDSNKRDQFDYSLQAFKFLVQMFLERNKEMYYKEPLSINLTIHLKEKSGALGKHVPKDLKEVINDLSYYSPEVGIVGSYRSPWIFIHEFYNCPIDFLPIKLPATIVYYSEIRYLDEPEEPARALIANFLFSEFIKENNQ